MALIGDTGSGKTFLEARLLDYRQYVIVLRTKPDDVQFPGYLRIKRIESINTAHHRYLLEPKYERQRLELHRALEMAWKGGGWTVAIDELYYAQERLKLEQPIEMLLTQGRSKHISVVCGMQRPVGVTRFALSQCTHWFVFRQEGRDVKTLRDAGHPELEKIVPSLGKYEFVYWRRGTREFIVAKAQQLGELLGEP